MLHFAQLFHLTKSSCEAGVCAGIDDSTSLLQVKHQRSRRRKRGPIAQTIKTEDRAIQDAIVDQYSDWKSSQSVLPPPVGHGKVEDNAHIVGDEAIAATMPELQTGASPILQAYDNSLRRQKKRVESHEDWDLQEQEEALAFNRELQRRFADQQDAYQKALQKDQVDITHTLEGQRKIEQEAVDKVAHAQKNYEEEAIVQDQAEAASLEGQAIGARMGLEHAAVARQRQLKNMEMREALRMKHDVQIAAATGRKMGITDTQRALKAQIEEGNGYMSSRAKMISAAEAEAARDRAAIKNTIVGAEALKERQIKQVASQETRAINGMTAQAEQATSNIVANGPSDALDQMAIDNLNGMPMTNAIVASGLA